MIFLDFSLQIYSNLKKIQDSIVPKMNRIKKHFGYIVKKY